jgi:hypothetical protein
MFPAELLQCEIVVREVQRVGRRLQQTAAEVVLDGRIIFLVISEDQLTITVENAEDIATVIENLNELQELLNTVLPEGVAVTASSSATQQGSGDQ